MAVGVPATKAAEDPTNPAVLANEDMKTIRETVSDAGRRQCLADSSSVNELVVLEASRVLLQV